MKEENRDQELRLKITEEIKIYFIKKINQHELISKKHKKVSAILNCTDNFIILVSRFPGCISISAFASLLGIPIRNTSSAMSSKIKAITAGIEKYKSKIKTKSIMKSYFYQKLI